MPRRPFIPLLASLARRGDVYARGLEDTTAVLHGEIVDSAGVSKGSSAPVTTNFGNLVTLVYAQAGDYASKVIKVPRTYVRNGKVHIHWTKSTDADSSGKNVIWRVSYTVFNGKDQDGDGSGVYVDLPDTYVPSDTTERVVHRTSDAPLAGLQAGYYVALKVSLQTPANPLSAPAFVTLDFTYEGLINRDV